MKLTQTTLLSGVAQWVPNLPSRWFQRHKMLWPSLLIERPNIWWSYRPRRMAVPGRQARLTYQNYYRQKKKLLAKSCSGRQAFIWWKEEPTERGSWRSGWSLQLRPTDARNTWTIMPARYLLRVKWSSIALSRHGISILSNLDQPCSFWFVDCRSCQLSSCPRSCCMYDEWCGFQGSMLSVANSFRFLTLTISNNRLCIYVIATYCVASK